LYIYLDVFDGDEEYGIVEMYESPVV